MSLVKRRISEIAKLNNNSFKNKKSYKVLQYLDTSSVTKGHFEDFIIINTDTDKIPSRAQRAVKKGTIVISTVRPKQEHYGFFDNPDDNVIVSSGFVTVDADESIIDSRYLYYLLTMPSTIDYLISIAATAVSSYPSFTPDDLGDYEIEFETDITKQRKLVSVLGNIDKKINLNNTICFNLNEMVKQIYDYWFVQFDFPDKNGKPFKSSGGKMIWSKELKKNIPENWKVVPLSDLILISKNGDWGDSSKKNDNDIEVKCFRGGRFFIYYY